MGLAEQLLAKKNAALAANTQELKQTQGISSDTPPGQSTIETGVMGSTSGNDTPAPGQVLTDDKFHAELAEYYKDEDSAYLLQGVRQIVLSGGRMIKPDTNNVIVPKDEETSKHLEHLDSTGFGYVLKLK